MSRRPLAFPTRRAALLALHLFLSASAQSAPISYGDFTGDAFLYRDVTETANSPGDNAPLFEAPAISGDSLTFQPAAFAATAASGSADLTDGQLNTTVESIPGRAIGSLTITADGTFSLPSSGGAPTGIGYALSLASITVFEIDGAPLATPVQLPGASASGTATPGPGQDGAPWSLALVYDLNAALDQAGLPYQCGATRIEVSLDHLLTAISGSLTRASINTTAFTVEAAAPVLVPPRLTSVSIDSATQELVLTVAARAGLAYQIQSGGDLITWTPGEIQSPAQNGELTFRLPLAGNKLFARVQASKVGP